MVPRVTTVCFYSSQLVNHWLYMSLIFPALLLSSVRAVFASFFLGKWKFVIESESSSFCQLWQKNSYEVAPKGRTLAWYLWDPHSHFQPFRHHMCGGIPGEECGGDARPPRNTGQKNPEGE